MSEKTITDGLFALKDENYRRFHAKLIPDIPIDNIIGVRTPVLRKYAKEVAKLPEANIFLESLPHIYYEENNLHGALLSLLYPKDIIAFMEQLERFLPYVDTGQLVICFRRRFLRSICLMFMKEYKSGCKVMRCIPFGLVL